MPQILAMTLVGIGLFAGYRWFRRESARAAEQLRRAENELSRRRANELGESPTLEKDPETGVYLPADRGTD